MGKVMAEKQKVASELSDLKVENEVLKKSLNNLTAQASLSQERDDLLSSTMADLQQ